jgi:O-6-methylguanine DNA methyltransferase
MTMTDDSLIPTLRRLGEVRAPGSLLPSVLDALGVAARYAAVETDIGTIWIAWTAGGVRAAMRDVSAGEFEQWHAERFGVAPQRVDALPSSLQRAVSGLLLGDRDARVTFDLRGLTPFEQEVLQTALRIPRGEVRPYNWIARRIGRPLAVRAVGSALAHNPIPYLIPCHRRGVRFLGSDTTRIFCYPTCRHARRTTDRHLVRFATVEDAQRAGYRACKVCTPVSVAA